MFIKAFKKFNIVSFLWQPELPVPYKENLLSFGNNSETLKLLIRFHY